MGEIYSKLTIKHQNDIWRRSNVFLVNFEQISLAVLLVLLLT